MAARSISMQLRSSAWCFASPFSRAEISTVADLTGADLAHSHLDGANLSGANAPQARLDHADLTAARLSGGDFCRASLRFVNLSGADLEAANLAGSELVHGRLSRANLSGANLSKARLDHADFDGADLTNANLSGASLHHVKNLSAGQLATARGSRTTVLPPELQEKVPWSVRKDPASAVSLEPHEPPLTQSGPAARVEALDAARRVRPVFLTAPCLRSRSSAWGSSATN
jgi:Pentapeptide repeats (8 copies)